jgi:hypothetical protein
LQAPEPDLLQVAMMLEAAKRDQVTLEASALGFDMRLALERLMKRLESEPDDLLVLQKAVAAVELACLLPFPVDLWKAQNVYYELMQKHPLPLAQRDEQSAQPDEKPDAEEALRWRELFRKLGDLLKVRLQEPSTQTGEVHGQSEEQSKDKDGQLSQEPEAKTETAAPTGTLVA